MKIKLSHVKSAMIMDCCKFLYSYEANDELIFETIDSIINCNSISELLALQESYLNDDYKLEQIFKKYSIIISDINENIIDRGNNAQSGSHI